jgi:hypothetical protein
MGQIKKMNKIEYNLCILADDNWWNKLTPAQQKQYLKEHPKSKEKFNAKEKLKQKILPTVEIPNNKNNKHDNDIEELNKLSFPPNRQSAHNFMRREGFHIIGQGEFADVYHKKGKNTVIKLFDNTDKAYINFLKLSKKYKNNPHFPKIKYIKKVANAYSAVELEKLEPNTEKFDKYVDIMHRYLNKEPLQKNDNIWLKENKTLKEALDLIYKNLISKGFESDIDTNGVGQYNIMKRGNTPVFIDPIQGT